MHFMCVYACALQVAEVLVRAFPEEEQSVRVALREKYLNLLHTLGPCPVVPPTRTHGETPPLSVHVS